MADKLVKKILTDDGICAIDYLSLANLPTFDEVVYQNSPNAVTGGAVYNALLNKLSVNDTAKNSEKLGGQEPSYYATSTDLEKLQTTVNETTSESINTLNNQIKDILETKLDATATATDSSKLGGQEPSYYATTQALTDTNAIATKANSLAEQANKTATEAMPIAGGKFTGEVSTSANPVLEVPQFRNIYAGTEDIGVGAELATGAIYFVYEEPQVTTDG